MIGADRAKGVWASRLHSAMTTPTTTTNTRLSDTSNTICDECEMKGTRARKRGATMADMPRPTARPTP